MGVGNYPDAIEESERERHAKSADEVVKHVNADLTALGPLMTDEEAKALRADLAELRGTDEETPTDDEFTTITKRTRRLPQLTVVTDSELATWNSCPQKHDFMYRQRLRPLVEAKALAVGSIFHAGMGAGMRAGWSEGWGSRSNHERLRDQISASVAGIDELVMKWATKIVAHKSDVDFEQLNTEVGETASMVKWMLKHYFERTQSDLDNFVLVDVERAFKVDLHDRLGRVSPHLKYAGVRDAVLYDPEYNQIVLAEHKTSGGNPHDIEKRVEMDTQTAGYLYALKQERASLRTVDGRPLGDAFLGRVMYNVLRKSLPRSPSINKDGHVSVAACTTTPEYYQAALDEQVKARHIPVTQKQRDFYDALVKQGDPYFARVEYHRTQAEIERWRSDTFVNAARIRAAGRDPAQRTRNTGHCNQPWSLPCPYRSVCLDPDAPELRKQYRVVSDPHAEVRDAEAEIATASVTPIA